MAAVDLLGGDGGAVRTKQVSVRQRGKAGGAFGHESKTARRARDREAGRLDEWERAELLYLWSGNDAAIIRSAQGAVVDRLLRAPPRVGEELDREVVEFLTRRGRAGAPREKLVEVLAAENVGATRHEARLTLRRMVGAGRVEFFVAGVERRKSCTCKSSLGEYNGESAGAPGTARAHAGCVCGAGAVESVPTEMVRIAESTVKVATARQTAEERWAKQDSALEAFCQMVHCGESSSSGGSRMSASVVGGASRARDALLRLAPVHARVLERVYGPQARPGYAGILTPEASRLAPLLPVVERARGHYVDELVTARGQWGDPVAAAVVDRSTYTSDLLKRKLDQAPDGETEHARWSRERAAFVAAVEKDAARVLAEAVEAYRVARGM